MSLFDDMTRLASPGAPGPGPSPAAPSGGVTAPSYSGHATGGTQTSGDRVAGTGAVLNIGAGGSAVPWWVWLILVLIALALVAWLFMRGRG